MKQRAHAWVALRGPKLIDDHKTADDIDDASFSEVSNYIFHDAVEAMARVWMKAWGRFAN